MSHIPLGRWSTGDDRPSPRQAALIAELLQAAAGSADLPADTVGDPSVPHGEASHGFPLGVENLIAAAVSEVSRVSPNPAFQGGIAPVLGAGVLHGILRYRREHPEEQAPANTPHVDERL